MVYLNEHLKKYPLMQIEDILKLYMQGILGPGHLVSSFDNCLNRIVKEYESIGIDNSELEEVISDKYVRIYLYPYYQKKKDFALLINAFIKSSQEEVDVEEFKREVNKPINKDNKEYITHYLNSGDFLISHSQVYKQAYHPHYLVINRKYLKDIY